MSERKYKYRLFYMEPPISQERKPDTLDLEGTSFDKAYLYCKEWITGKAEGTVILMLAQLDR